MDAFSPLTGALASTPHLQATQAAQRAAQVRREQNKVKVSSIDQDTLERQVESADAVEAVHDRPEDQPSGKRKRQQPPEPDDKDEKPHVDFTA